MTHVLTQKALNTLAEFLNPVYIFLCNSPGPVFCIGRAGFEFFYSLFGAVVNRYIGHQVGNQLESLHRLITDRTVLRQILHTCHAHQFWLAVDLCRARTTFSGLAIPPYRKIIGLFSLYLMYGVKYYHAFGDLSLVFL